MNVKYVLALKGNPGNPDAPKKYYAQTKSVGDITLKQISREIAENSSTVSDTDVLAVLNDLTKILNRHLKNGEIVRFGDFGTFQINIKSEGAESEEKFTTAMITDTKVTYRPGSDVREMLNNIKFEKL
ncbi:DNA-binding protein [Paludibacter propionicigenes WB4]|uniref:DNA-binding protein n=1 Tax=Paludibacter propionicigenes (strain DSM 17365 / JCM 13257 / WB4) TaxID=694427 RepID=E4T7P5_PALPW|nr:HU family DNA-binding protein [Paludibacter propionicigenes]ADQ80739.1 DNA-binding protein [Paludibacter propionicigenes WB4]